MSNRYISVYAAAALFALGGCGAAAKPAPTRPAEGAPAASSTGTITIGQSGTAAPNTIWYVRIETMQAKPLVEVAFPGKDIALTRKLDPAQYRVISWYRKCDGTCPTSGEKGLGPLEQVCGAPVTIVAGRDVAATVAIRADDCAVEIPKQ